MRVKHARGQGRDAVAPLPEAGVYIFSKSVN